MKKVISSVSEAAFQLIVVDLNTQKAQIDQLNIDAQAEGDVLKLIDIQKTQLPALQISIGETITKANAAKQNTPAIDEAVTQAETDRLKKQTELQLQDSALISGADKLTKSTSGANAIVGELIHNQLMEINPDETIILVNLQKLQGTTNINSFETFYHKKYGASIESDLRSKLVGTDLQLALELLNIKAIAGQVAMVNAAPSTNADYTNASVRINAAIDPNAVFAELIPFKRDKAKLDLLTANYTAQYPGHTIDADIRAKIPDPNQQSYAIYLLSAHPSRTKDVDWTGGLPNAGVQQNKSAVLGGTVAANNAVTTGNNTSGLSPNGYSLNFKGPQASDSHWLQFIWREVTIWNAVDVNGVGIGPGIKFANGAPMGVNGANYTMDLTTVQPPKWYVDSANYSSPFYDETFQRQRSLNSMVMFDNPGSMQQLADHFLTNGAKLVSIEAHFSSFLVTDFSPVLKEKVDVKYLHTTIGVAVPPITTIEATHVTQLDPAVKAALNADVRYQNKFDYIR
ncbi:hypothetical protein BH11BAC7_BH11BAC7_33390 [soil metagenome]